MSPHNNSSHPPTHPSSSSPTDYNYIKQQTLLSKASKHFTVHLRHNTVFNRSKLSGEGGSKIQSLGQLLKHLALLALLGSCLQMVFLSFD